MNYCRRLPDRLYFEDYSSIERMIEDAHHIFGREIFNSKIIFNNKPVYFFETPIVAGYEQGFYHCTTTDSDMKAGRTLDVYRVERVPWIGPIIKNVDCELDCCDGFMIWIDPRKDKTHIYMDGERYLIVLEEKKNVYNFITAFYVERISQHRKLISKYNKYG
jgi:hypothetical protein